ncbi:MAG TPA: hypothetical protein VGL29_02465 [Blastocatellia bacterium]|jgi:hypothetical protein
MKVQRILIAITALNMGLTIFVLAQLKKADADSITPVLRGRELEIVDDQGRVRASIKLHAADPKYKWPDGKIGYPETVMLRLVDQNGRPEVKLGASVQGAGLGLVGETDSTQAILKAEGAEGSLKLANKDGKQQLIKP